MDNKKEERTIFETYKEQVDIWYKSHNIIQEKTGLYCDFLCTLLNIIDETYLGPDIIKSNEDIVNHFNWCLNKVISNFEHEKIYFNNKGTHYDYLWLFFYKAYYTCNTENKTNILFDYFKVLFSFDRVKTPPELESFTDLYKIFDQNLKKIN
jgi:hypothetical protein